MDYAEAFNGVTQIANGNYTIRPGRTGWHKFNLRIASGSATLTLLEGGNPFEDLDEFTASVNKAIFCGKDEVLTLTVASASSLVAELLFY